MPEDEEPSPVEERGEGMENKPPTPHPSVFRKRMGELYADLKVREFLPLKVVNFLLYGGMTTLFPFLTLHARSLGIYESELGLIYGFLPVAGLLGPPVAGMIGDKIGNFKIFLSFMVALSGFSALLFMLVPIGRIEHPLPLTLPYMVSCEGASLSLLPLSNYTCDFRENSMAWVDNGMCDSSRCLQVSTLQSSMNESLSVLPEGGQPEFLTLSEDNCTLVSQEASSTCLRECTLHLPSTVYCTNKIYAEEINSQLTFWLYALIRSWNSVTLGMSIPLFQGAGVSILKQYNGDFGFQRMYGSLGPIIMSPLSGLLIDKVSEASGTQDFSPSFYIYFAIKILCALLILMMNLEFKAPSNSVLKDFHGIITNVKIVIFLIMCLLAGSCFGAIDTFLFWLLHDIGASKKMMGLTLTVGNAFGIPILIFATPIIKKLGCVNTIVVGFCVYAFRFFGYSIIYNPWLSLIFEALECFTFALLITAAMQYAADLSSLRNTATLQSMIDGIHHGVGRGFGSFVTGFIMAAIGVRGMFQVMAGIALICAVFYFLVNHFLFSALDLRKTADPEIAEKSIKEDTNIKGSVESSTELDEIQLKGKQMQENGNGVDNKSFNKD